MQLPSFPKSNNKTKKQLVSFGGLNVTQTAKEGELISGLNLSSDEYPFISTRKGRTTQGLYTRPSALFGWGGLLVVDGTDLIYNGSVVGTVTEGEKQFAVINTKLCIFPDKKYLDLTNNEFKSLEASVTAATNSVTFGADYIEMDIDPAPVAGESQHTYVTGNVPLVKTYTSVTWDAETGWTKNGYAEMAITDVTVGKVIIPAKVTESGAYVIPTKLPGGTYSGEENNDGYYFAVTAVNNATGQAYKWEKFNAVLNSYYYYTQSSWHAYDGGSGPLPSSISGYASCSFNSSTGTFSYSGSVTIPAGGSGTLYTGSSSQADRLVATSTGYTWYDSYPQGPYSGSYYTKGSTSYGYVYGAATNTYPSNGQQGGYWYVYIGASGFDGVMTINYNSTRIIDNEPFTDYFVAGDAVSISGCATYTGNNLEGLVVKTVTDARLTFESIPNAAGAFTTGTSEDAAVVIARNVPALDFICESNNRLFGTDGQTIYGSALGDPTNFYRVSGLSTDSYTVAVGSDGEFTGCIPYSGSVLFFKEDIVYVLLGNYPGEYSLQSYNWMGLQAGSHKSLQIINEALFYKGKNGVYVYTGGTPRLISYELGMDPYYDAVAGNDGLKYYISMRDASNVWGLYVYDTLRSEWLPEDAVQAAGFAYQNNVLYMLDVGLKAVRCIDGADSDAISWVAEFAPFNEVITNKKSYSRLTLRVELNDDATLTVAVSHDGGAYVTVYTADDTAKTPVIPIIPRRCDSFTVKISGTGKCIVKSLTREYRVGSEADV